MSGAADLEVGTSVRPVGGSLARWRREVGVLSTLLVAVLVLCTAWSIQEVRWILGRAELTDFLLVVAAASVLVGTAMGALGWRRWAAIPIGVLAGALIVPVVVGGILAPGASIPVAFRATADAVAEAYLDLAWRGKYVTPQAGHYMLALGLVVWSTGLFAGYAVAGRRRPLDAVLVSGLVLVVNMGLTWHDQLRVLVVFTVAALGLFVRLHALGEAGEWLRARRGDAGSVAGLYLHTGSAFAVLAIAGSLLLTTFASSAPLAGAWSDAMQGAADLGQSLARYLPRGGSGTRFVGAAFGTDATITGQWVTNGEVALGIRVPPGDSTRYYWRAVAYDTFTGNGWTVSQTAAVSRAAGASLLDPTSDRPGDAASLVTVAFTVEPVGYVGPIVFSPNAPASVDVPTELLLAGENHFASLRRASGTSGPYAVTAVVPRAAPTGSDATGGTLTANRLRSAGADYPAEVAAAYLAVPRDSLGPSALALLATVEGLAPAPDPYDIAATMQTYLRSSVFTYATDVSSIDCGSTSVVECFATYRRGYCQHYASTMTLLLRQAGIPARFVQGFLPGQRDARGREAVPNSASHAWVEAYFPGFGWIPFDPTGGGVAQLARLPEGAPVPVASTAATPRPSRAAETDDPRLGLESGGGSISPAAGSSRPVGAFALVGILLVVAVLVLAFAAWRRGPSRTTPPEAIFAELAALAGRLGFGRRPTETVYEYTGYLAGEMPDVRPELETVARATVEVAYGRAILGPVRLSRVRAAEGRLRTRILRLLFRRRGRRR